jgi:glycosyltransferase involved in cell wall biosynthesis
MDVNAAPKKILYLTYDGLSDPLGQSQILPYIKGLANKGYEFTILSFEKKGRYAREKETLDRLISESNIKWVPLWFTHQPPLLSKFYDAVRMRNKAFDLQRKERFDMVHCRSYIAADIGLQLKKKFGTKFFFDMRGFWADEKRDGGSWKASHPVFRRVYSYYKRKEAAYLQNADYIVSLTKAGKSEMLTWPYYNAQVPVNIIPCCADIQHFSLTDENQKVKSREVLGIEKDRLVLSYLGSLGTWYMLDEMLKLYQRVKEVYPHAFFLFVTPSDPQLILSKLAAYRLKGSDVKIIEARRPQVPGYIKASDINISFIRPVYSKLSSSPTKLGEVLSMGIPVISNSGVGDVEAIVNEIGGGFIFHQFSDDEYNQLLEGLPALLNRKPAEIRAKAITIYSLSRGIDLYSESYRTVLD